eukprot:1158532-Pelagomonas_calceolata.AAC.16
MPIPRHISFCHELPVIGGADTLGPECKDSGCHACRGLESRVHLQTTDIVAMLLAAIEPEMESNGSVLGAVYKYSQGEQSVNGNSGSAAQRWQQLEYSQWISAVGMQFMGGSSGGSPSARQIALPKQKCR